MTWWSFTVCCFDDGNNMINFFRVDFEGTGLKVWTFLADEDPLETEIELPYKLHGEIAVSRSHVVFTHQKKVDTSLIVMN